MAGQRKYSKFGNIIIGLFFIAAGLFPTLATFNIGPLGVRDINGPSWLGLASGGIFVAAGFIVMVGKSAPILRSFLGFFIVLGLTSISNWIAFGLGERVCSGSVSFFGLLSQGMHTDLACRIPFGFGAIIMDGFLFYSAVALLHQMIGDSPPINALLKLAQWVVLITLAPILIPFLLVLAGRSTFAAIRIRLKTGSWPRNESFIQKRLKK